MSMSKTFVVNDYKIAEIMEILMDTKMTVYDDGKYGFLRTPFIWLLVGLIVIIWLSI